MIGYFDGTVEGEGGEMIKVSRDVGWAEDHHSRW